MEEQVFAAQLASMLETSAAPEDVKRVESYEAAGVATHDAGFVVTLYDGTEFQVTVVAS
jgi:hypothetical protein